MLLCLPQGLITGSPERKEEGAVEATGGCPERYSDDHTDYYVRYIDLATESIQDQCMQAR